MPTLHIESELEAPLESVWSFHQDLRANLPKISDVPITIESADLPLRPGSRATFTAPTPLGPRRFTIEVTDHVPPHPTVTGAEARFTDRQLTGPFRAWTHHHEFEALSSTRTRLVDHITYAPPYGPLGHLLDPLLIRPRLKKAFAHRHAQTRRLLESLAPR